MGHRGVKNIIFCKICFWSSYTHPVVIGKHDIKILSDNLKNWWPELLLIAWTMAWHNPPQNHSIFGPGVTIVCFQNYRISSKQILIVSLKIIVSFQFLIIWFEIHCIVFVFLNIVSYKILIFSFYSIEFDN